MFLFRSVRVCALLRQKVILFCCCSLPDANKNERMPESVAMHAAERKIESLRQKRRDWDEEGVAAAGTNGRPPLNCSRDILCVCCVRVRGVRCCIRRYV